MAAHHAPDSPRYRIVLSAAAVNQHWSHIVVITADQVKQLREKSGAGIMECKRALEQVDGDLNRAIDLLKQQGLAKAEKKSGRSASQGLIEPYIHGGGRIGAIVEVNCETDFVARTADFRELAHDLAMQVAATSPRFVAAEEVAPEAWSELEREYGDREKAAAAVVLLDQPFIKDAKLTIRDIIRDRIAKLGENIVVRRFARFEVGADQASTEE
jgi:elongation factor Ts